MNSEGPGVPDPSSEGGSSGLIRDITAVIATLSTLAGRVLDRGTWALDTAWGLIAGGASLVSEDPERLYHTFLRSGRVASINYQVNDQEAGRDAESIVCFASVLAPQLS